MSESLPHILIIDDREGEQSGLQLELTTKQLATVSVRHPQHVQREDLFQAQLVLVDFQLDNWSERDEVEALSLRPVDGLALAALLRRAAHNNDRASPTAFALHTGQIAKLAFPLPAEHREHALARINNLEWVFRKGKESDRRAERAAEIARAILKLPPLWTDEHDAANRLEQLALLLDVRPGEPAREELIADIERCLPPIHELSVWSHGLTVIRWLLHRILPYPCFLWDVHHLAARLRVDPRDLRGEMEPGKPLAQALDEARYTGILSGFQGGRWWRSRVELFLWERTRTASADTRAVHRLLAEITGRELQPSEPPDHPVVCINSDYQPLDTFASIADAVRIRPDDWPPFADPAWTTRDLATNERKLKAIVVREERERLEEAQ